MPDPMRQAYRYLSDDDKAEIAVVKEMGTQMYDFLETLAEAYVAPREFALAKTKLQEAVFWAVHGITAPK